MACSLVGAWVVMYMLTFIYCLLVTSGYEQLANTFLPLSTAFAEMSFIYILTKVFRVFVCLGPGAGSGRRS